MEGHKSASKKRTAPQEAVISKESGGPTHKKLRAGRTSRSQGAGVKRPPPILQWLQPAAEAPPTECDLQKRLSVEQFVEMVTSVWGGGDEGQSPPGKKIGSGESSWGKSASRADGADSSSGVSGQEVLSTRSGTEEAFCRSSSEGVQASDITQDRRPPSPVYATQLDLVKQAMDPGVCNPPLQLEDYIAAKLAQLCRDLTSEKGQATSPTLGEEAGQLLTPHQQCGDHLEELLQKIVREVRRVVLGSAPLNGSILEQIAEAAFSNKGVAVSPCEMCGQAAAVDMAQVLSITLGRTQDGSEMRIGHAAVALLNARLQAAGRGAAGSAGEEGALSIFPLLLSRASASPPLSIVPPLLSRASASPSPSESQQSSSFHSSSALSSLITPPPPAHIARSSLNLPPPAPKFSAAPLPMLLPPLPSVTMPPSPRPIIQAVASESPLQAPTPVWRHDFSKLLAGVLGTHGSSDSTSAGNSDLLDVVKGNAGWSSPTEAAASPFSPHSETPTMSKSLTAFPLINGGRCSILLPLKARARELASKQEKLQPALTRERGEDAAVLDTSPKASSVILDNPFHVEEPTMERHLSADEMTIQACLEEHDIQLCTNGTDAYKVAVTAVEDDSLDLVEDPLATAYEWEGFLGADLSAAGPLAGVSEAELLSLADQLLLDQEMAVTSGTLSASDKPCQKGSGSAETRQSALLSYERDALDFLSKASCSILEVEPTGRRFGVVKVAGTSTSTQQGNNPSAGLAEQVQEASLQSGSNRYTNWRVGVPNVDDEQPQKVRSLAALMSAEAGSIADEGSTRKNKRPSQTGFRWESQKSTLKRLKGSKIVGSSIGQRQCY